jgi:hypothetical protein
VPLSVRVGQGGSPSTPVLTIENLASTPLQNGRVRLGSRVVQFFAIPAGGSIEVDMADAESFTSRTYRGGDMWQALDARGCEARTAGIERYIDRGAIVVYAEYPVAPLSYRVAKEDGMTTHTQLVRLVVPMENQ